MPKVQTLCVLVVVLMVGLGALQMEQKTTPVKEATISIQPVQASLVPPAETITPPQPTERTLSALSLDAGDYGCDTKDVAYRVGPGSTPSSTRVLLISDQNLIMGGYEFTCDGSGCIADYNGGLVATLVKTAPAAFELTELKYGAKTAHLCTRKTN